MCTRRREARAMRERGRERELCVVVFFRKYIGKAQASLRLRRSAAVKISFLLFFHSRRACTRKVIRDTFSFSLFFPPSMRTLHIRFGVSHISQSTHIDIYPSWMTSLLHHISLPTMLFGRRESFIITTECYSCCSESKQNKNPLLVCIKM